jgi:chemotaxis signal transduction protein
MSNTVVADQRFILTQIDEITLMFPANLVAETLLIERTQILSLPFYPPAVLGCVHSGGQIVTIISPAQSLGLKTSLVRELLTVVRMGENAGHLAGVGILVDRMMGSQMGYQLSVNADGQKKEKLFDLTLIDKEFFGPRRWHPDEYTSN